MATKKWIPSVISIFAMVLLQSTFIHAQTVGVTTWHNDNLRTGQNLNETTLTPSSLPGTFGQLCSFNVDGQVYSQPLIVTNITINGQNYSSAVFVVTEADTLYAFSGAAPATGPCTYIGSVSLVPGGWLQRQHSGGFRRQRGCDRRGGVGDLERCLPGKHDQRHPFGIRRPNHEPVVCEHERGLRTRQDRASHEVLGADGRERERVLGHSAPYLQRFKLHERRYGNVLYLRPG
jgi:hypothetical protein